MRGDVCPSSNELCGVGGKRVFLVEFKEPKKIPDFAQAAALFYPKSQTTLFRGAQECPAPRSATTLLLPQALSTPFPTGYSKKTMELGR